MFALVQLSFLSGWALTAGIGILACSWWFGRLDAPGLTRSMRIHLVVGLLLVVLGIYHVDPSLTTGWIETILLVLFVFLLASTVVGLCLVRLARPIQEDEAASKAIHRWLHVHVALTYGLFGAAVFHGVFVHGHGMLAFVFPGE